MTILLILHAPEKRQISHQKVLRLVLKTTKIECHHSTGCRITMHEHGHLSSMVAGPM